MDNITWVQFLKYEMPCEYLHYIIIFFVQQNNTVDYVVHCGKLKLERGTHVYISGYAVSLNVDRKLSGGRTFVKKIIK